LIRFGKVYLVYQYKLENTGNDKAADGTSLNLRLSLLHSNSYDIEEMYGVNNDLLYSKDLSGMEPNSSDEDEVRIRIPASVFKKFGYDAVRLSIEDADGNAIDRTDDEYIQMNAPMNIRLNGGNAIDIKSGETADSALTYDSNVFLDGEMNINYSVDDTSVATVDENGTVTAIRPGKATLSAVILPEGTEVTTEIKVDGGEEKTFTLTYDADISEYAVPAIQYASGAGIINGFEDGTLRPASNATRAQLAAILNKAAELFK